MSIKRINQRIDEVTIAVGNLMDEIEEHYGVDTDSNPNGWPDALIAASDLDIAKVQYYQRIMAAIGND